MPASRRRRGWHWAAVSEPVEFGTSHRHAALRQRPPLEIVIAIDYVDYYVTNIFYGGIIYAWEEHG
jgi:hypothetical protein